MLFFYPPPTPPFHYSTLCFYLTSCLCFVFVFFFFEQCEPCRESFTDRYFTNTVTCHLLSTLLCKPFIATDSYHLAKKNWYHWRPVVRLTSILTNFVVPLKVSILSQIKLLVIFLEYNEMKWPLQVKTSCSQSNKLNNKVACKLNRMLLGGCWMIVLWGLTFALVHNINAFLPLAKLFLPFAVWFLLVKDWDFYK